MKHIILASIIGIISIVSAEADVQSTQKTCQEYRQNLENQAEFYIHGDSPEYTSPDKAKKFDSVGKLINEFSKYKSSGCEIDSKIINWQKQLAKKYDSLADSF